MVFYGVTGTLQVQTTPAHPPPLAYPSLTFDAPPCSSILLSPSMLLHAPRSFSHLRCSSGPPCSSVASQRVWSSSHSSAFAPSSPTLCGRTLYPPPRPSHSPSSACRRSRYAYYCPSSPTISRVPSWWRPSWGVPPRINAAGRRGRRRPYRRGAASSPARCSCDRVSSRSRGVSTGLRSVLCGNATETSCYCYC